MTLRRYRYRIPAECMPHGQPIDGTTKATDEAHLHWIIWTVYGEDAAAAVEAWLEADDLPALCGETPALLARQAS